MAMSTKERAILQLGPFIGLDATSDPTRIDSYHATDMLNIVPDREFQAYTTVSGRQAFSVTLLPAALLCDPFYFKDSGQNDWYYVVAGDGNIYRFQQGSGSVLVVNVGAYYGVFCSETQWVLFSNAQSTPIKIDNLFNVTDWGIYPPQQPPALSPSTEGSLTQNGSYAYVVTFGNAANKSNEDSTNPYNYLGVESSPSPISSFLTLQTTPSGGSLQVTGANEAGNVYYIYIFSAVYGSQTFSYTSLTPDDNGTIASQLANMISEGTTLVATALGTGEIFLADPSASNSYSYYGSVVNATGGSGVITPTTQTQMSGGIIQSEITLSNIPVSTDPQVAERNIYRIGGSQSEFQLVGTINDNVTTTYTDTLSDADITGQTLVEHRDPPANFFSVVTYQDRVWGLGYSNPGNSGGANNDPTTRSQVWYSQYMQPWAFDNTNQVINVGTNINNDYIVGGAAMGSMLFIAKNKSCWGIVGSSPNDYLPIPLFNIGAVSQKSIKAAKGIVVWLSPEKIIYTFDGMTTPQDISTLTATKCSVKGLLDQLQPADLEAASIAFWQDYVLVSFPTLGYTLGYSLLQQVWFKLGFTFGYSYYDLERTLLLTDVPGNSGQLAQWFASEVDLSGPISSYFVSGIIDDPTQTGASQARHVVLSSVSNPYGTATITVNCWQNTNLNTQTKLLNLLPSRQVWSLQAGLTGQKFQVEIAVPQSAQKTTINSLTMYAIPKRVFSL